MELIAKPPPATRAQAAPSSGRVSVYVPRDVAFDFVKMTDVMKRVLGKLGCDGCHSGRLIDIQILEDFVVNPKTLQPEEILPGQQLHF